MFDTYVTVVGNVLTAPEWRRTKNTGSLVAHFKVASTARRLDRESGRWVDGNSLRVRVTCWRKLAEGVAASVITGDPVVVVGRMYTRDWVDENNNRRVGYEIEAVAVGHDLSRGRGRFARNRPTMSTSVVEDEGTSVRAGGEATEAVPADQVPVRPDDGVLDDLDGLPVGSSGGYDPFAGPERGFPRAGSAELVDDDLAGDGDDLAGDGDALDLEDLGGDDLGGDADGGDFGDDVGGRDELTGDDFAAGGGGGELARSTDPIGAPERPSRGRRRSRTPAPA